MTGVPIRGNLASHSNEPAQHPPVSHPVDGGRVAIVAGCRTPFAKAGTVYRDLTAVDLAKACVRELVERTEIDPAWMDTVVMGQVIPSVQGAQPGPRGGAGHGPAGRHPRPHREPRLRLRQPGHRRGGQRHPAGPRRGRHRGRRGEPLRRAHPAQPADGAHPRRGLARAQPGRAPQALPAGAPARPRARDAGHRRALHRPHHGPVGGEDGEGERHHPRGAGPDRLPQPPATPRPRWTTGGWPPEMCAVLRAAAVRDRGHARTTSPPRHVAGGAGRAAARVRPQVRHRDRGQLLAPHRRRGRGAADVRGRGRRPRATSRWPSSAPGRWPRWIPAASS